MPDRFKTIARFRDPIGAELARNNLQQDGIDAVLLDQHITGIGIPSILTGGIRLQVPQTQIAEALRLLDLNDEHDFEAEDEWLDKDGNLDVGKAIHDVDQPTDRFGTRFVLFMASILGWIYLMGRLSDNW